MKPLTSLKFAQLAHFSRPKCDRAIYKAIRKYRVRSIIEFGLGDGTRYPNMIRVAQTYSGHSTIRYTGVDMFDARQQGTRLPLIQVHQSLGSLSVKSQLVPGAIDQAVARIANSHLRTDLIIFSAGYDPEELDRCWFYVPRMLHANSIVLVQPAKDPEAGFKSLSRIDIERMVKQQGTSERQAA